MSVTVRELHMTGDFAISATAASIDREFISYGSTDQGEIEIATKLFAGVGYYGLVRSNIQARFQGANIWFVTITYSNIDPQQAAALEASEAPGGDPNAVTTPGPTEDIGPSFGFDFSGQTVPIFQSLETIACKTAGAGGGQNAPADNQLALNATEKGVEGISIFAPSGAFERKAHRTSVTFDYLLLIFHFTGCVNFGNKFFGANEGEILYLGATGQQVQFAKWDITHKFAFSPNEVNLVVAADDQGAPLIQFAEKKGWDYLDVEYENRNVNGKSRPIPVKARLERVYRDADLRDLGIGG